MTYVMTETYLDAAELDPGRPVKLAQGRVDTPLEAVTRITLTRGFDTAKPGKQ